MYSSGCTGQNDRKEQEDRLPGGPKASLLIYQATASFGEALSGSQCPFAREFTGWSLLLAPTNTPESWMHCLSQPNPPSFQGCCHSGTSSYKHTGPLTQCSPTLKGKLSPLVSATHQAVASVTLPKPSLQLPPT